MLHDEKSRNEVRDHLNQHPKGTAAAATLGPNGLPVVEERSSIVSQMYSRISRSLSKGVADAADHAADIDRLGRDDELLNTQQRQELLVCYSPDMFRLVVEKTSMGEPIAPGVIPGMGSIPGVGGQILTKASGSSADSSVDTSDRTHVPAVSAGKIASGSAQAGKALELKTEASKELPSLTSKENGTTTKSSSHSKPNKK